MKEDRVKSSWFLAIVVAFLGATLVYFLLYDADHLLRQKFYSRYPRSIKTPLIPPLDQKLFHVYEYSMLLIRIVIPAILFYVQAKLLWRKPRVFCLVVFMIMGLVLWLVYRDQPWLYVFNKFQ